MFPFFLYLMTALVAGFHLYTLLALSVYGAPFNPLQLIAFAGSVCLLICAYVSLFRPYLAARIALLALLTMWSFYGPAIGQMVRARRLRPAVISLRSNSIPECSMLVASAEFR
jgi:hypothetical protein